MPPRTHLDCFHKKKLHIYWPPQLESAQGPLQVYKSSLLSISLNCLMAFPSSHIACCLEVRTFFSSLRTSLLRKLYTGLHNCNRHVYLSLEILLFVCLQGQTHRMTTTQTNLMNTTTIAATPDPTTTELITAILATTYSPSDEEVLSLGAIIGAAVGGAVVLVIVIILIICCIKKSRERRAPPPAPVCTTFWAKEFPTKTQSCL